MSSVLLFFALSAASVSGAYAPQQAGSAPLEPALEARVQKLGKELRCATCQGLSIADSPASMARAQLDKIRELVSSGKSDDEIRGYFVARYGEWILLSPKAEGFNWLVWLGPALLIGLGFAVILRQIRRSPASKSKASSAPPSTFEQGASPLANPNATAAGDDYIRLVRSELEQ